MGKKKNNSNIGRLLIKERFKGKRQYGDTHLHTTELNDGYDWNRLNLQSVTEQNTLDEFLATAELAGTEFQAEKLNIKFIQPEKHTGLLTIEEERKVLDAQEKHRQLLRIPRRPAWNVQTSPEELDRNERDSFLEWRRELAQLQEVEGLILTPFERNLDFWRQLWRVIERSDIVVQIVDARNPCLFRCEDLEVYVNEIDKTKINMLLINKADFLTKEQRHYWAEYFDDIGVKVCFWSAVMENERNQAKSNINESDLSSDNSSDSEEESSSKELENIDTGNELVVDEDEKDADTEKNVMMGTVVTKFQTGNVKKANTSDSDKKDNTTQHICSTITFCECIDSLSLGSDSALENETDNGRSSIICEECKKERKHLMSENNHHHIRAQKLNDGPDLSQNTTDSAEYNTSQKNNIDILTGEDLLEFIQSLHTGKKYQDGVTTVGLVGYPNVGKSSTINAILQTKKVPVSATPGRTKHFQTLYVDETTMLCDCPGLVMPTFVSTKAEMIVSGILPIDQMRDYVPPVSLISKYIPRSYLEATYGFLLPKPNIDSGEEPDRLPTAHEILTAHACMRGFMTHKGIPDFQRSARVILKDYVNGKLLYCHPPTNKEIEFCPVGEVLKPVKQSTSTHRDCLVTPLSSVDKDFFLKKEAQVGVKGKSDGSLQLSQSFIAGKSWKKHGNRNKKEKLRRKYKDLD